jgi:hypothetical protein
MGSGARGGIIDFCLDFLPDMVSLDQEHGSKAYFPQTRMYRELSTVSQYMEEKS